MFNSKEKVCSALNVYVLKEWKRYFISDFRCIKIKQILVPLWLHFINTHCLNNLVHIPLLQLVDSFTNPFHASRIGFSSGLMILSVCFICSLIRVRLPLPLITLLHFTLGPEFLMHDNRCRSIWNLLVASLSSWPAPTAYRLSQRLFCESFTSEITTTLNDNLPAVRGHAVLPHMCRTAAQTDSIVANRQSSDSHNGLEREVKSWKNDCLGVGDHFMLNYP